MLISFRFKNFRSFADEAELSLVAHKSDKTIPGAIIDCEMGEGGQISLLPAVAIYGPNAAGKTNVILAMQLMRLAIRDSQDTWKAGRGVAVARFGTDKNPALFEAEFVVEGTRYRYGFTATPKMIVDEWLYAYPKRKERMLFERHTGSGEGPVSIEVGPSFAGTSDDHEAFRRRTRDNSLYLSSCAQDNQSDAAKIAEWFRMKTTVVTTDDWFKARSSSLTSRMCSEQKLFRSTVSSLLQSADSSLTKFNVKIIKEEADELDPDLDWDKLNSLHKVEFIVETEDGEITLPLEEQSRGFQKLYSIATQVVFALSLGEVLFFDELEGSMHPHVAAQIVSLFQSKSTNTKGAQLVFTTHDTNFLDIRQMRRDQIWFVEKSRGKSHLYPLLDFAPRKDEDLKRGYLRGRYGAIPALGFEPHWQEA